MICNEWKSCTNNVWRRVLSRMRLAQLVASCEKLLFRVCYRILVFCLHGTSTTELDDGTFYREASESHRNYSATRSWLEEFAAFCETCQGFEIN